MELPVLWSAITSQTVPDTSGQMPCKKGKEARVVGCVSLII